jgi:hypothetical protein
LARGLVEPVQVHIGSPGDSYHGCVGSPRAANAGASLQGIVEDGEPRCQPVERRFASARRESRSAADARYCQARATSDRMDEMESRGAAAWAFWATSTGRRWRS